MELNFKCMKQADRFFFLKEFEMILVKKVKGGYV